jgi:hypothetical protein
MSREITPGRAIGHAGVAIVTTAVHAEIEQNRDLTDEQKLVAHALTFAARIGGHLLVEGLAQWAEERNQGR